MNKRPNYYVLRNKEVWRIEKIGGFNSLDWNNKGGSKMKRIVLVSTLLLLFVLTAGTASAGIILPPGWPFLPPIITPPVIEAPPPAYYPDTYGYYSYPYGYHGYRGPGYWGYGGRGHYGPPGSSYRGHGYRGHGGYRR